MRVKIKKRDNWDGTISYRPMMKRYWISKWQPIWYLDVKMPTGANEYYVMDNGHYGWHENVSDALDIVAGCIANREQIRKDREIRKCR
jgi:hypothetical protein